MKKSKILMPLAGIAAVGAIAPIVTLASCGKSYVNNDDKAFLESANAYLAKKEGQISCHKAVTILKNLGIDVPNYKLSNHESQFAYDASAKRFIIMHGDNVVAAPDKYKMENTQSVFVFTTKYDKNLKYGQYLMDDFELPTNASELEVKTSLDVGNNQNIEKITYVGDASNAKYILLRTYSQMLTIDAKKDTIFHMGVANNLTVTADAAAKPDFYEVGWVGYLKSTNVKLNTVVLDKASEGAQIDILDPTNTSMGAKFADNTVTITTAKLDGKVPTGATEKAATLVTQESELVGSTFGLYRLSNDLELNSALTVSATIVLDLNGKTLTSKVAEKSAAIAITAASTATQGKLIIMDSSATQKGTMKFTEQYITVTGTQAQQATANLTIEGGTLDYTGTAGNRSGFIQVGEATTGAISEIAYSEFFMYGGKIKTGLASGVESKHANQANGVYIKRNVYVQITYGTIESSEVCIRGTGTYSGSDSYIDISGGTFKQTSSAYGECIFQPQGGTLNITGGTFEGRSCIASKNGNVHINGGYFHATGAKADLTPTTTAQEQDTDGSVLCMELTKTQYGINPSITVHNATLYSEKSYVLQVYGQARETGSYHYAEADFFSGVFYFGAEAGTGSVSGYSGVRIANAVEDDVRVNQYGGSWVKAE